MPITPYRRRQRGFTLIEVLVALLVTAVGLLGLLKIQALAISSTKEAGSRGLVAMQVESLTAMMHANPFYWAAAVPAGGVTSGPPQSPIDISNGTVASGALATAQSVNCITGNCTPLQLAAVDVQTWALHMKEQFPTSTAHIVCPATLPITCYISVSWQETQVAVNATTAQGALKQTATLSFSVYVQP